MSWRRASNPSSTSSRPTTATPIAMPATGASDHEVRPSAAYQSCHGTTSPAVVPGRTQAATTSRTTSTPTTATARPSNGASTRSSTRTAFLPLVDPGRRGGTGGAQPGDGHGHGADAVPGDADELVAHLRTHRIDDAAHGRRVLQRELEPDVDRRWVARAGRDARARPGLAADVDAGEAPLVAQCAGHLVRRVLDDLAQDGGVDLQPAALRDGREAGHRSRPRPSSALRSS